MENSEKSKGKRTVLCDTSISRLPLPSGPRDSGQGLEVLNRLCAVDDTIGVQRGKSGKRFPLDAICEVVDVLVVAFEGEDDWVGGKGGKVGV